MKEFLPEKYKNNIFYKFFKKLKILFFKKTSLKDNLNSDKMNQVEKSSLENLKVDVVVNTTEFQKKEFMKDLSEHPELLENFSNERLKIILQYYQEENERKRKLLNN